MKKFNKKRFFKAPFKIGFDKMNQDISVMILIVTDEVVPIEEPTKIERGRPAKKTAQKSTLQKAKTRQEEIG